MRREGIARPRFGGGPVAAVKVLLMAACLGAAAWLFLVWSSPTDPGLDGGEAGPAPFAGQAASPGLRPASFYQMVVEKDLFRPSRAALAFAGQPRQTQAVRGSPPRVTLLGTVILDDGGAAVLSYPGAGPAAAYHRVGDIIDGFAIRRIQSDMVVFEKGGEWFEVEFDEGSTGYAGKRARRPGVETEVVSRPADIPPGLVPRRHRSSPR